jgi:hypothetical protein
VRSALGVPGEGAPRVGAVHGKDQSITRAALTGSPIRTPSLEHGSGVRALRHRRSHAGVIASRTPQREDQRHRGCGGQRDARSYDPPAKGAPRRGVLVEHALEDAVALGARKATPGEKRVEGIVIHVSTRRMGRGDALGS